MRYVWAPWQYFTATCRAPSRRRIDDDLVLAVLLLMTLSGCHSRSNTEPNARTPASEERQERSVDPPTSLAAPSSTDVSKVSLNDVVIPDADDSVRQPQTLAEASPRSCRLLLLLPDGPRLGDVYLTVHGQSHSRHVQSIQQDVMAWADTDQDGEVTWQEATTSPRLVHGQVGNDRIENEEQRRQIVYRCDINRNLRVDPDELVRFIAPRAVTTRWIDVLDPPSQAQRDSSPLFEWLDTRADGVLDAGEIRHASSRLRMLDSNDRGAVDRQDLPIEPTAQIRSVRSRSTPSMILLREDSDWPGLLFLIEERYSFGAPLQAADLPQNAERFARIDANADGSWDPTEVAELLRVTADIDLFVDFDEASTELRATAPPGVTVMLNETVSGPTFAIVSLGVDEIIVQVTPSPEMAMTDDLWERRWREWDQNADESLNRDEYPQAEGFFRLSFDAADTDGDGSLQRDEARLAVERRDRVQSARCNMTLTRDTQPLWTYLDVDRNGRLAEREIQSAAQRLGELDAGGEPVTFSRFPQTHLLTITLGRLDEPFEPTFELPRDRQAQPPAPTWFLHMDQNRDGEISVREFLGPAEIWQQLDRNADDLLQLDEVREGIPPTESSEDFSESS